MVRYRLILFLLFAFTSATAQVNRYFVYFKDKQGTPYLVSEPSQFLSERSIARRQNQVISITEEDLPVNPAYVTQVKATGANTFFTSRWWNGVLIETDASNIANIQSLPIVKSISYVAPGKKLSGGRQSSIKQKKNTEASQPVNIVQLQQIGLDVMHDSGYRGEDVLIAIFDSGFQGVNVTAPFTALFTEGRIKQTFNFVNNTSGVYQNDDHGTEVFSVMAAYTEGMYTGGAHKADYCLYLTEDVASEYRIEEFNWTFAAERADSAGVDIINSSLGYYDFDDASMNYEKSDLDGNTAIVSIAARKAFEKGMLVVCSAGNEGGNSWKLITTPADADGVLAAGSINAQMTLSPFSSIGPSSDNRVKPDVVAMGSGTSVVKINGTLGTASGTSLASPLIASLAAGLRQAFPELNVAQIYESIIRSSDQASKPDNLKGYGLPHFTAAKNYIERTKTEEIVSLYPNPVSGNSLYIKLKSVEATSVQIRIYDSQGKRVEEINYPISWMNNPFEYDISKLYVGLYFIQLQMGSITTTIKFVRL
jgi:serine protease AprX